MKPTRLEITSALTSMPCSLLHSYFVSPPTSLTHLTSPEVKGRDSDSHGRYQVRPDSPSFPSHLTPPSPPPTPGYGRADGHSKEGGKKKAKDPITRTRGCCCTQSTFLLRLRLPPPPPPAYLPTPRRPLSAASGASSTAEGTKKRVRALASAVLRQTPHDTGPRLPSAPVAHSHGSFQFSSKRGALHANHL